MDERRTRFPNETPEFRAARNRLLEAEMRLRQQIEEVAALRRSLPPGGVVEEDYEFAEMDREGRPRTVLMSQLFTRAGASLVVYSFMFSPQMKAACPMCTSLLDGLDGQAPHIGQRLDFVVVARSPIERIMAFAQSRGWSRLRLLSSHDNDYNVDYLAEDKQGRQLPMLNVFTSTNGEIRHRYATELYFERFEHGHPRHVDSLWPLWNMLDLTPEGRGTDWFPKLEYAETAHRSSPA